MRHLQAPKTRRRHRGRHTRTSSAHNSVAASCLRDRWHIHEAEQPTNGVAGMEDKHLPEWADCSSTTKTARTRERWLLRVAQTSIEQTSYLCSRYGPEFIDRIPDQQDFGRRPRPVVPEQHRRKNHRQLLLAGCNRIETARQSSLTKDNWEKAHRCKDP